MNAKPFLILSLIVNLGLAAGLTMALKSRRAEPAPTPAATAPEAASQNTAATEPDKVEHVTNTTVVAAAGKAFDWRLVESDDYKKYIANLRAIGCPEETIRDIIIADVNKLYDSKRREMAGPKKKFEFWKSGAMMGAMMDTERMEKERALNKEKRALLTELLGSPPDEKPDLLGGMASQIETMFDFLPAEKRSKVFEAMQDMQAKMQKSMRGGAPDGEDIRKAMKESEATLAAILTPEEMLDYNLRFSMTANTMRMQLAGFEPTEQEFLDLFKMRKAHDDEYGGALSGTLSKTEREKADAAKKEMDGHVKELLGENRYADYERSQDWSYQQIYRITEKNNLPKSDAIKVYDMKKLAEEQAKNVRNDKSLDQAARDLALRGIRTETENSFRQVMGAKAYESYENNAWWLKNISPDPKPEEPKK